MVENKKSRRQKLDVLVGSRLWLCALGASVVALVVYSLTIAGYLSPDGSTHLFTQWAGMDALDNPVHPVWGSLVSMIGGSPFSPSIATHLNMLSLVCGVLSAGLVCLLTGVFIRCSISHEDTVPHAQGASCLGGLAAALVFVFSSVVWKTSTHLDFAIFDVFFALLAGVLVVPMLRLPRLMMLWAFLLGLAVAVGLADSAIFMPLLPVYLMAVIVVAVRTEWRAFLPSSLFVLTAIVGYMVISCCIASSYMERPEAVAAEYDGSMAVVFKVLASYAREIRSWFSLGWLVVALLAVMPFVACAFAAPRGLNNERTWSQYLFHAAMTVCVILAAATGLSPDGMMQGAEQDIGRVSPVATTTLVALAAGYLAAYWFVLARTALPVVEHDKLPPVVTMGKRIAPVVLSVLLGVLALASLVNVCTFSRDRGAFADACANAIVERLKATGRTWLVTDGLLDDHLRVAAATQGHELNLVCLQRDLDKAYLKELGALVKARQLKAGAANLDISIQLGVLPFLQDWFLGDPDVTKKAAVFGVPDLWYMAERQPVPECLFFGGVQNARKEVDGAKALAEFKEFWKTIEPLLYAEDKKGSRVIPDIADPQDQMRLQLRRHVGFIGNNLGVLLQDLGMDKEAFEVYELVLKTIDCDNVCTLFNEFEMARVGVKEAVVHKTEIERKLKAIKDDPNRRYALWSLSRYYGYIRSPEIFVRLGHAWSRSGQPGNAIANAQRAAGLVPADRQAALLNMMAAFYASGNNAEKSRETYNQVLAQDARNHDALMGLARLALREGSLEEARAHIQKAAAVAGSAEVADFDWALLHMLNNDFASARLALQKLTDMHPKSLQSWSLLAGVLLQEFDQSKDEAARKKLLEELESVILPKMEAIAASPRDYHVQMTRALVLMRKGKDARRAARDALVVASLERPGAAVVSDMVLGLDIELDDHESAENHARQVLRVDRANKLANYVMGSQRLNAGDYADAETFLRTSVAAPKPLAAAQNDLAECLRRLNKSAEAETFARAAVKNQPDLYIAWETLGSSLLDQNKNLEEAEKCIVEAIRLAKEKLKIEDYRMQMTLTRVQFARGDKDRARVTLRIVRSHLKDLSKYDRAEFEKLEKSIQGK